MATTEPGVALDGRRGLRLPRRIRQLSWRTWRGVLVRSARNFVRDNCADWAAALTYYGVLALFPSAIVVVSLVGLVSDGERTVDTVLDLFRQVGAGSVVANEGFVGAVREVVEQESSAKVLLSFGLLGALWSASGYIGAFTRASNAIYGVREGRPFWKLRPLQIGFAGLSLLLLAVVATGLIVSGPVADAVGDLVGAGGVARTVWRVFRWPVLALIMMALLSLLFWIAPNVRQPRFRWLTPGARWRSPPGWWPHSGSACTWPTSARTTPRTAASGPSSPSWSGSTCPTRHSCSACRSTPNCSVAGACRPVRRRPRSPCCRPGPRPVRDRLPV